MVKSAQTLNCNPLSVPLIPLQNTPHESLTACRPVLNHSCSNCTCPRSAPLPQHPQTPLHASILYTREGKIQQLPMPSHPASRVPGVLLIPRSCGCLSPFPLTPSPYLSCKGKERKCRENGRGGLSKAPLSHRRLAVRGEKFPHAIDLRAQITQVWWGMYCWRWEDRGGLVPSSEPSPSSVIEYFIRGAQTGTRHS